MGSALKRAQRGFNRLISDRFDLTLECIRRFYLGPIEPARDLA
jgi:hypothetical protein